MNHSAVHSLALGLLLCLSTSLFPGSKESQLSPQELAERVRRSVVVIRCLQKDGTLMLGSGFFIDSVGLLATNAHVVANCADTVISDEANKDLVLGRTLVWDDERDIAILAVSGKSHLSLKLASSSSIRQGQQVYAVGHPEGLEYTISEGIVSAFREVPAGRLIQTTAPISPGSSGGPLVDARGIAIGMTTLFLKEGQNLNFAVPSDAITEALTRARQALRTEQELPVMSSAAAARIARSFRKQKQFEIANKIVKSALQTDPSNLNLLLEEAELAWDENRLEEAESISRRMLELDPNFAPAHQTFGAVLMRKRDTIQGCQEQRRTLELNPDDRYRAYANSMLFKCEIMKRNTMTPEAFRTHVANIALPYLEAALTWGESANQAGLRADYAISLKIVGRTREANAEARHVLELPNVTDIQRNELKKYGLPEVEVRVISHAQHELLRQAGILAVTGIVANESSETVSRIRILVECYDSNGKLTGTGTGYVEPQNLAAGESGSFEISIKGPAASVRGQGSCNSKVADFNAGAFPW